MGMDPVDILMLCVVGLSVLAVVILQNLENLLQESKTSDDEDEKKGGASPRKQLDTESFTKTASFPEITGKEKEKQTSPSFGISEEAFGEWEGIERNELEKIFGRAMVFVGHDNSSYKIDGNLKLELYGLQKVALEGACLGSQPMPFKVSARAKWKAWQKLGSMSRETAMEKYVNILAEAFPGWKSEYTGDKGKARNSKDSSEQTSSQS